MWEDLFGGLRGNGGRREGIQVELKTMILGSVAVGKGVV